MVVPEPYRHILLREFRQVVVDNKTGIAQIVKDIATGMMSLATVSTLLLLVGRADVLNNSNLEVVLEELSEVLQGAGYEGKVVIAGPLPAPHDKRWICNEMREERLKIKRVLQAKPNIHFCDAGDAFMDQFGVVPQLLDRSGLTLDGKRELALALAIV